MALKRCRAYIAMFPRRSPSPERASEASLGRSRASTASGLTRSIEAQVESFAGTWVDVRENTSTHPELPVSRR